MGVVREVAATVIVLVGLTLPIGLAMLLLSLFGLEGNI
jgi:hypothetical protein